MKARRFLETCAIGTLALSLAGSIALAQQMAPAKTDTPAPAAKEYEPQRGQSGKDVIWIPTPDSLVDAMLDTAKVTKDDTVIDLGSGDGRTVIAAAKRGARAIGVEFNPNMVEFAQRAAAKEGVTNATFIRGDIFQTDFSHATVVTLFLLNDLNARLRPIILNMKPGTRVVSNTFHMGDWEADQKIQPSSSNCTTYCQAFYWVVPAKIEGKWQTAQGELALDQKFQMVSGSLKGSGGDKAVTGKLTGDAVTLTIDNATYTGRVDGNSLTLSGKVDGKDVSLQGKRG